MENPHTNRCVLSWP